MATPRRGKPPRHDLERVDLEYVVQHILMLLMPLGIGAVIWWGWVALGLPPGGSAGWWVGLAIGLAGTVVAAAMIPVWAMGMAMGGADTSVPPPSIPRRILRSARLMLMVMVMATLLLPVTLPLVIRQIYGRWKRRRTRWF